MKQVQYGFSVEASGFIRISVGDSRRSLAGRSHRQRLRGINTGAGNGHNRGGLTYTRSCTAGAAAANNGVAAGGITFAAARIAVAIANTSVVAGATNHGMQNS